MVIRRSSSTPMMMEPPPPPVGSVNAYTEIAMINHQQQLQRQRQQQQQRPRGRSGGPRRRRTPDRTNMSTSRSSSDLRNFPPNNNNNNAPLAKSYSSQRRKGNLPNSRSYDALRNLHEDSLVSEITNDPAIHNANNNSNTKQQKKIRSFEQLVVPVEGGEGYASDVSNNVNNNTYQRNRKPAPRRRSRAGSADQLSHYAQQEHQNGRISVSDGSGSEQQQMRRTWHGTLPGFKGSVSDGDQHRPRRRPSQSGRAAMKRGSVQANRGSYGDTSDYSGMGENNNSNRGSGTNLKTLPEDSSLRGSLIQQQRQQQQNDDYLLRDLNAMSVEDLMTELKGHGITVQGIYERPDLINVCAHARKRSMSANLQGTNSFYRPVSTSAAGGLSHADNRSNDGSDYRYNNRRSPSFNDLRGLEDVPLDGNIGRPSSTSGGDVGGAAGGGQFSRRRRRTNDSQACSDQFSANPQQGGQRPSLVSYTNATLGSGTLGGSGTAGSATLSSRHGSRTSLSSMDPDDSAAIVRTVNALSRESSRGEMAVYSAPLGAGIYDFGPPMGENDSNNPNDQMGLLLRQMQRLEEGEQQQQQERASSRGSFSNSQGRLSRRTSSKSGLIVASSGFLVPTKDSGGSPMKRQMSNGSHRSGISIGSRRSRASGKSGASYHDVGYALSEAASGSHGFEASYQSLLDDMVENKSLFEDPDIGKSPSRQGSGTGPALLRMSPMSSVASPGEKEKVTTKRKFCPLSKKTMSIGVIMLLLIGGGIAAALILVFNDGTEEEASATAAEEYLEEPPSDIEGRCSPSNLPGSLSACLSACLPSACCYPDYSEDEKSCLDENDLRSVEACRRYQPYCDIFYDTWPGATEGVLRTLPDSVVQMCLESNFGNDEESMAKDAADGDTPPADGSFERKRLRSHGPDSRRKLSGHNTTQEDDICLLHCKASLCCHAPSDVEGSVLSASGVYTDVMGDHVVTNCQSDFGTNKPLCETYDKFCTHPSNGDDGAANPSWMVSSGPPMKAPGLMTPTPAPGLSSRQPIHDVKWTSRPTPHPTVSSSPTLSLSPSSYPSMTSKPTLSPRPTLSGAPSAPTTSPTFAAAIIPPANTLEISAACSGTENVEMINAEISAARVNCISACRDGLCCYSEILGYGSWMPSCRDENEDVCQEYYPCIVLAPRVESFVGNLPNSTVANNTAGDVLSPNSTVANNTEGDVLSPNSTVTGTNSSITSDAFVPMDEEPELPPPASEDLSTACSYESLLSDGNDMDCWDLCQPGLCCSTGSCLLPGNGISLSTSEDLDDICRTYSPCYNLNLLYDPPSNIEEICNGNFTSECASMCSTVSCCFSESLPSSYSNDTSTNTNASSCYAYFEQTCSGYAPFCDPVDAVVLPNPPADLEVLCSFEFADLCRAACDVASCCFGQSSESSCVENNEELCQSYYPCAVLYSG